jgi:hypothetical protein
MYLIAGTSRVANELCLGIKPVLIGPRCIVYSQMTFESYILGSTILFVCYKRSILMVCSATNISSDTFLECPLAKGFSSYAKHNAHTRIPNTSTLYSFHTTRYIYIDCPHRAKLHLDHLVYTRVYSPNCSFMDSRTIRSYSARLSRYNLQQSIFAPLSRFGSFGRRIGHVVIACNQFSSPANIDITLRITFSTLCTGLQRSEACSYMVGSSPGVCNIEMQTFPSAYTKHVVSARNVR